MLILQMTSHGRFT